MVARRRAARVRPRPGGAMPTQPATAAADNERHPFTVVNPSKLEMSRRDIRLQSPAMEHASGSSSTGAKQAKSALRSIPSVNELADSEPIRGFHQHLPRKVIVEAARRAIDEHRDRILKGTKGGSEEPAALLASEVVEQLTRATQPPLRPAINATGIIIHTGLGRAPLAKEAVEAMADAALHYAPVELDMASGERGHRSLVVRELLCSLTGAESATVVNNNAAALLITLAALARGREVIVSRGELIEIGGSFRLPEVMQQSGALLREVGTTNKTRISDFERAVTENTAAILKVHPSNYRIVGFTESPEVRALAELARARSVPLLHDIGSGVLHDMSAHGLGDEPDARSSIEAGADLVLFSGDKLLGGPQAGIIVGRKALVSRIEKHPLMRAVRLDKLTLSALGATLQLHRDPGGAVRLVPVLRMLTTSIDRLRPRAEALAKAISEMAGIAAVEVSREDSYLGGGSLPAQAIASVGIRLRAATVDEGELARRLRTASPPILPRVQKGWVVLDLRTVFEEQDELLARTVREAVAQP